MTDPKNFGRYVVRGMLGEGSMAKVYLGHDPQLDRDVAIKTLKDHLLQDDDSAEELLRRFGREARLVAKLKHDNFVAIYEYVDQWDPPFIAMERVEGKTLAQHLRDGYRFKPDEVVEITRQILSALGYAHQQGVIHRDVKSQNIFWQPGGRVKVTDFGIAQIQSSTLTRVGSVMGTAAYMAPEQFKAERVDERSDLWSVGIILFELLAGKKPFRGDADTVRQQVLHNDPPFDLTEPYRRIPDEFEPVIRKALRKDPNERFQSAHEFNEALQAAFDNYRDATVIQTAPPKPLAPRAPSPETQKKKQGVALLLGSVGFAALAAIAVYLLFDPKLDPSKVEERLRAVPCGALNYELRGKDVRIAGYVRSTEDAGAARSDIARLPGVRNVLGEPIAVGNNYCALMDLLASVGWPGGLAEQVKLDVRPLGASLAEGQLLSIEASAPSFAGFVTVDYFDIGGKVTHLMPESEAGSKSAAPQEIFRIGGAESSDVDLEVACPCGTELALSVFSSVPLNVPRGAAVEPAGVYLDKLKQAIATRDPSAKVAVQVAIITTGK